LSNIKSQQTSLKMAKSLMPKRWVFALKIEAFSNSDLLWEFKILWKFHKSYSTSPVVLQYRN
jgi:hypothetical protein